MKATAKDLRMHSKELLDVVSRGEDVVITFRGKPCANLVQSLFPMKNRPNRWYRIKKIACSAFGQTVTISTLSKITYKT
ncbi:MAG: type II toxin-antitoxin system prevent-host-death family antitoxin [Methylococcaceae bacterium]|nr:type II toxin-antitoxin system prevent-host-death family antitoxin [Methylococcaceae bacterium]MDP2393138.1 type II toxin-antitoxin system prevent-host-death family antitoxin [Methylococcaceae bacterium]MDP3019282.1 type II toxin-antitoxin system prevent-host-death family antitoxin [Methylococcaceae bacterium]MDP3931183.1 type II toxin-antitoxin system prevent-host-death family antitoxin [Methylococcaceae bacterium]MDZ4157610.1 type II toxin-antitoxin system prevent-host-death family antitox